MSISREPSFWGGGKGCCGTGTPRNLHRIVTLSLSILHHEHVAFMPESPGSNKVRIPGERDTCISISLDSPF